MREVNTTCPKCEADVIVEAEVFWEGGWVAQFEPPTCPGGCVWSDAEAAEVSECLTIHAVEPREPIV